MKRVIKYVLQQAPETEVQDIKRAYWREAKKNPIDQGSDFEILQYLKANKLTK
jgi:hypothetical protein